MRTSKCSDIVGGSLHENCIISTYAPPLSPVCWAFLFVVVSLLFPIVAMDNSCKYVADIQVNQSPKTSHFFVVSPAESLYAGFIRLATLVGL